MVCVFMFELMSFIKLSGRTQDQFSDQDRNCSDLEVSYQAHHYTFAYQDQNRKRVLSCPIRMSTVVLVYILKLN